MGRDILSLSKSTRVAVVSFDAPLYALEMGIASQGSYLKRNSKFCCVYFGVFLALLRIIALRGGGGGETEK